MRLETLDAIVAARAARRAVVVVTNLDDGGERLVRPDGVATDPLSEAIAGHLRKGTSGVVELHGAGWFVAVHAPATRLVAVGAVKITGALVPMARMLGFETVVVEPRDAFAQACAEGPDGVVREAPREAFAAIGLDRDTAVVALTHEAAIDDAALDMALRSDCFYVGALGSRRTHAARTARLVALGHGDREIGRIRAPVGLSIGAVGPSEIALSTLAQIVEAMRLGGGGAATPPGG